MSRPDLVALVTNYDTELKSLREEMSKAKEEGSGKAPEKDKYKQLARRLKEERNLYKCTVEDKL